MNEQALLGLADDELVLGWRDSEWTGVAPTLEEDVAFSSIAQNEIGHARAVYQLLSDDADALAFDRPVEEYRCAQLVERVGLAEVAAVDRGTHTEELGALWEEMTIVRRSAPAGAQW